ncbi:hypothetical protein G3N59_24615 [Paraburkholderia sp. Ac-20340]|uniref:DUF6402 family protein n=1 Tax=Paraburkholderia sp. Ac-20340 TaxID=2703888 RepID=UPI00198152D4|nr:DUF6402 family protein [Paraburkholderia sp. Ac-20340]MBN3856569.1 hypothetical protein [Paraburkholderia sp. Ac-20340]
MYLFDEEIPSYKPAFWADKWKPCGGCKLVDTRRVSAPVLSMDKPPPALADAAKDRTAPNIVEIPPFDIQEIPDAMRLMYMPIAAKLMQRWFAGELNYAPTSEDLKSEKNIALQAILRPYKDRYSRINTWTLSKQNVSALHRDFQFQRVSVGSTITQKIGEFIESEINNNGIPDDLTGALGAFGIYAAPNVVMFSADGRSAEIKSVYVYVKDSYDFTDKPGDISQYLGHWSSKGVIVVPYSGLAAEMNVPGLYLQYPVARGNMRVKGNVYYPVHNKDFRQWAIKHQRGGDFIVFSDLMNVSLKKSLVIEL